MDELSARDRDVRSAASPRTGGHPLLGGTRALRRALGIGGYACAIGLALAIVLPSVALAGSPASASHASAMSGVGVTVALGTTIVVPAAGRGPVEVYTNEGMTVRAARAAAWTGSDSLTYEVVAWADAHEETLVH